MANKRTVLGWSAAALVPAAALTAVLVSDPGQVTANVADVNPGPSIERDLCLTVALPGGASECGDLRLAQALPAVRMMNQAKAPVLLYNSEQASPHPVVAANVTLPSGKLGLSRVVATLKVEGTPRARSVWKGSDWPDADVARIAIGYDAGHDRTRAYRYSIEVTATYLTGTTTDTARGQLAVVNRRASHFGAGWWMAGVEQLVLDPSGGPVLWVGGDGSTRRYTAARGDSVWGAPSLDRPDTLKRMGHGWVRLLPGRARVEFDSLGRHVRTVNRLQHAAEFKYDSAGLLTSVWMSPAELGIKQTLHYGADRQLDSIVAPPNGSVARTTKLMRTGMRIDSIVSPDTSVVRFGYADAASPLVVSRTDARGSTALYRYDAGQRIASTRIDAGPNDSIVTRIRSGTTLGLVDAGGALDTARAYARIDGPLPDRYRYQFEPRFTYTLRDTTAIWLDKWGGPRRIVNAEGQETLIFREDSVYKALATKTVSPTGLVSVAHYNALGRPDTVRVLNPLGDTINARDAVTVYEYGMAGWPELPTRTESPTHEVVRVGYDSATGNRIWQQDGRGDSTRVRFFYNAHGQVTSTQSPLQARARGGLGVRDSIEYDATLWNVSATISPTGFRSELLTDAIGQVVRARTPIDPAQTKFQTDSTVYDVAGRVIWSIRSGPPMSFRYAFDFNGEFGDTPAEQVWVHNEYDAKHDLRWVDRWSVPDTAHVGHMRTGFVYDAIGRKKVEIAADSLRDSTAYDAAGNVTSYTSRRGLTTTMEYDLLHRLTLRIAPSVYYKADTMRVSQGGSDQDVWRFPLYRRAANGTVGELNDTLSQGLTLSADTSIFTYDARGMRSADNGDARIRRSYYPNGALATDSTWIRAYASHDFSQHVYGLRHEYDLSGRRVRLHHPAQLGPHANWVVDYGYDPLTGALTSVADDDRAGGYAYDLDGRLKSVGLPDSYSEETEYDDEGRMLRRWDKSPSDTMHADTFQYDARGKVVRVGAMADSARNAYSGLGNLAWSYSDQDFQKTRSEEEYTTDALGNSARVMRTHHDRMKEYPSVDGTRFDYQPGTGRLIGTQALNQGGIPTTDTYPEVSRFDASGNRVFFAHNKDVDYGGAGGDKARVVERSFSYYGADEKLRVMDRRTCAFGYVPGTINRWTLWPNGDEHYECLPPYSADRPAFEEYRYDALGRRVLVATRQQWACGNACFNGVTRTVWDGDQVLHELRAPIAAPERDTGQVPIGTQSAPLYGQVAYMFGAQLDRPLLVYRMNYDTLFPGVHPLVPHSNWAGSFDNGTINKLLIEHVPCRSFPMVPEDEQQYPDTYMGGIDRGPGRDSVKLCMAVDWPAAYLWRNHLSRQNSAYGARSWMGSLIQNKRDETGQLYMRNRFYDPQTGRFTQEDPIGLAGGLNAYGFAGGDPVSYSDPYGLSAEKCPPYCPGRDLGIAIGGVVGGGIGVVGAGVCALASDGACLGIAGHIVALGITTGGAIGGAIGFYQDLANNDDADPVGTAGGERAGKPFTPAGRRKTIEDNTAPDGSVTCVYCGRPTTPERGHDTSLEIDHTIPKAQQGNGDSSNAQPTCKQCNRQKSNRTPQQWERRWYRPDHGQSPDG